LWCSPLLVFSGYNTTPIRLHRCFVGVVALFGEEACVAVVLTLNDVQGQSGEMDAGAAGHGRQCSKSIELGPFDFPDWGGAITGWQERNRLRYLGLQ